MESQIPFTGGSGRVLDRSLAIAGIAKHEIFVTNAVNPVTRPTTALRPHEIANCKPYLHRELEIVQPRLVIGLGRDAEDALKSAYPEARQLRWPVIVPHATAREAAPSPDLLFAPHPSWIKWQLKDSREQYVTCLARALEWGFRDPCRLPG